MKYYKMLNKKATWRLNISYIEAEQPAPNLILGIDLSIFAKCETGFNYLPACSLDSAIASLIS